jgi:hypothetical protein
MTKGTDVIFLCLEQLQLQILLLVTRIKYGWLLIFKEYTDNGIILVQYVGRVYIC